MFPRKVMVRTKGKIHVSRSQEIQETESENYMKFTALKHKQELAEHGFGAQLLKQKNPNMKEILSLSEKPYDLWALFIFCL